MERKIPLLRLFVGPPARTQWSGWLVVLGSRRNASFMPRVLATARIHSVILPLLHSWTSFLNIVTLPCCVSGTFSIRSGLLAPVHSFATRCPNKNIHAQTDKLFIPKGLYPLISCEEFNHR
ncbi:LOW QUALITY PROTEIN: cytochrome c biogenesis CcmF N-terminal-like mitochondrial protein 2 [Euphorbia lathyris]|uniref:LOW QUALITY PROTEIN: cytochrome c biogenesis CcmF N-terminal-like mitochondrial protein 2 n=1 Tax=Euphorbia lathyris TaxID=212925 RepID=UPI0033135956